MKINSIQNLNIKSYNSAHSYNESSKQNDSIKKKEFLSVPFQAYKSNFVPFLGAQNLIKKSTFVKEGFIGKNDNFEEFLSSIFNKIYSQDNDVLAKQKAMKYLKQGKIALSQTFYRLKSQKQGPIGPCSTLLPVDANPKNQIMNGLGLAVNLNNIPNPVKVLNSIDHTYQTIGKEAPRVPAGIALLDVKSADIKEFITYHRGKSFSDTCFSTSVNMSHDFLTKVDANQYVELTNGNKVNAKGLYQDILEAMHERGNPGIIFENNLNAANPIPSRQFQGVSTCAEMGLEYGEPGMFSYINLDKFLNPQTKKIDYVELAQASKSLSHLLNNVIDVNLSKELYLNDTAMLKRRFGIGAYGYADLIAKMGYEYGSPEALNVLGSCLETINYASKHESMQLAKSKGAFPLFNKSRYNEAEFFVKHDKNTNSPITDKMWEHLFEQVQQNGLRNATTTSLPPTCSSARMSGTSYCIEPFLSLKDNKTFEQAFHKLKLSEEQKRIVADTVDKTGSIQGIEFLDDKFKKAFKTAAEIDYYKHLGTVAKAQKFVDDSISKTINLPNNATTEDIDKIVRYADNNNLKGITVYRG